MSNNNLQKISRILLPSKELSLPKKTLLSYTHSLKDLNEQTVKTKLDACLYGLKTINDNFKKGIFQPLTNQSPNHSTPLPRNLTKTQLTYFPRITHDQHPSKTHSNQLKPQQLMTQNSYLMANSEIVNASILKERLNSSCFPINKANNNSTDLSKLTISKTVNKKLLEKSLADKSVNFSLSFNKKISSEGNMVNDPEPVKKIQFPPKIKRHLYEPAQGKALSKQNRYFLTNPLSVDKKEIQKIGLYESSNRYRKEFICHEMNNLSPKVEKKELEFAKVCKQNELFLTRPKELEPAELDEFLKGEFIINQAKPKKYFETLKTEDVEKELTRRDGPSTNQNKNFPNFNDENSTVQDPIAEEVNEPNDKNDQLTFLQIKNYEIAKNASYMKFRVWNIEKWQEIESLLSQIVAFVKQLKINSCKFKANNLLEYWSGKRLTTKQIESILKISKKQLLNKQKSALESVLGILRAKKQMKSIINAKAKRLSYMKWVSDRISGIRAIRKETEYKVKKAYEIHERLFDGDYQWDTEIYISSFSENPFVRNTTQYMESFENMFTHMWKESSKHMILVIPTVNSEIVQIYQQKLKIKRSVTLICPEVHELSPLNMSLSGCLLFSYEALNKIKQLIEGKKAIIIPGKYSSPKYELLISEFLRTPLMTSLKPRRDLQFQKELFSSANLSVLPFISIRSATSIDEIIKNFAKLLLSYRQINNWVFKINGDFGGRGLATFSLKSSKVLKSMLSSCKDTIKPLEEYLKRNLRLKLKINFENSLFMLGDYLQRLAEKGGIIEEQKDQADSYQISFFIENKLACNLVSCFKCFAVSHSNKAYIYEPVPSQKISAILSKLKATLQTYEYLGYVSVNLVVAGDVVFGVEVKPYLTQLASVEPFIKTIESKRQLKLNLSPPGYDKMENEFISATLRNDFAQRVKFSPYDNHNLNHKDYHNLNHKDYQNLNHKDYQNCKLNTDQSHLFSNANLSSSDLQTLGPLLNDFTYLFIPNIILTDVPIPKKAEFIESMIVETFNRPKFDILGNNLVLYLSNGLSLSLLIIGKDIKKIKKTSIEVIRQLSEKTGSLKIYCGKNEARDVFQFGDIIKAVTQIKG